jgi:hypothetical protein
LGIGSLANEQSCSSCSNLALCKVSIFLNQEKAENLNYKIGCDLNKWKTVCNCELGPAQWYSPDPLKPIAPGARSDRVSVVTASPPSGHSCRTGLCHLLLPASTCSPCSTASTCANPVALIRYKPSSRSKGCFHLFSLHVSLFSLLRARTAPIGRVSPRYEHHCCFN